MQPVNCGWGYRGCMQPVNDGCSKEAVCNM